MASTKYKVETGVQLLARLIKKPSIENFYPDLFQPALKYNDVVEVLGNNNSAYLLIDMICEALLPSKVKEDPISVLVFNTIGLINYKELIDTLKKRIVTLHNKNGECQIEVDHNMLHRTLNNLLIVDIYDATQFYTTIHNLDNILTQHQSISLLIFDTLTAFYWSEQGFKITKMDLYVKNVLRMIQKVSKEYKVVIIYTRPEYFSSSKESRHFSEVPIAEGVNFQVQVDDNSPAITYQVDVRTKNLYYKRHMSIIDNQINWQ